jgi:hypothetical protein
MFWAQNPEIFMQQCPKWVNVFSGNEFCQNRDIRQNVFTETFVLMCPKRSNVFSGNEFCPKWGHSHVVKAGSTGSDVISKINTKNKKLKAFER